LADADRVRPLDDRMTVGRWLPKKRMGRLELSISAALVRHLDEGPRQAVRCNRCTETRLARRPATHPSHRQEHTMTAPLKPAADLADKAKTPFPGASPDYERARKALLAEEIEFRRHMTRLVEQRRALPPGPVIRKNYRFKDEQGFEVGLRDLFGDKDTLVTYFWMYGPQRERPCPMCTNWLGAVNGNAADIKQRVALKILGRSGVERQYAFAQQRGWRDLNFVQTIGDDYANDLGLLAADGSESPALVVFKRDGDEVRLFWASEMTREMGDPGQDPRDAPDIASLWSVLDLTPGGRGTDWYPKLQY
jgi:predicted dithiol-disulfide oxidoreductase (DUF899 family)